MIRNWIIITLCVLILSCEKQSDEIKPGNNQFNSNLIDTVIFSTDTFRYSFGYFGDEEGILIIKEPQHARSCEILNKHWEERILQYIPEDEFLGVDSLMIKTEKGSDGASPSTNIDSILVILKIVKDDFHKKLIGRWNWISSCGGFTGGCWYPNENNTVIIEFTYDMIYNTYQNDTLISDREYYFLNSFSNGDVLTYEIGFSSDYDTYYWFSGDKLNVQGGDFVEEYEKIE